MKKLKLSVVMAIAVIATFGLSVSLQSLLAAWAPPGGDPPENNVKPPVYNFSDTPDTDARIYMPVGVFSLISSGDVITSGNVGIGTESPQTKLHIIGTEATGDGPGFVSLLLDSDTGENYTQQLFRVDGNYRGLIQVDSDGLMSFYTKGTEEQKQALTINSGGYVGIGTANPTTKLVVAGGAIRNDFSLAADADHYQLGDDTGKTWIRVGLKGSTADMYISTDTSIDTMIVKQNGFIGLGTISPTAKLDINGTLRIRGGVPGIGKVLTSGDDGTATWQTPTGGTDYQTLGKSGNTITLTNGGSVTAPYATVAGSLSANGANCAAGQFATGVNAFGAAEGCSAPAVSKTLVCTDRLIGKFQSGTTVCSALSEVCVSVHPSTYGCGYYNDSFTIYAKCCRVQ